MREHLTDEAFAGLIDHTLAPEERDRAIRHVRACASCREAMLDAGRLAETLRLAPGDFPSDPGLRALGYGVPERAPVSADSKRADRGRGRIAPGWVAAMAAAVVVAAAIAFWSARPSPWDGGGALDPAFAVVLEASNRGPFILPGVEADLQPTTTVMRSGYVESSDSLRVALRRLRAQYERGESPAKAAQWTAAAEIATGNLDGARALLADASSLQEDDPDLATLDAVVAYIDGDPERAEGLLRWVLTRRPGDDAARVNLALVLRDLGRPEQAAGLLRQVMADRPGTPVARRAEALLSLPVAP